MYGAAEASSLEQGVSDVEPRPAAGRSRASLALLLAGGAALTAASALRRRAPGGAALALSSSSSSDTYDVDMSTWCARSLAGRPRARRALATTPRVFRLAPYAARRAPRPAAHSWQYDDDSSYYVSASYCGPFDEWKYCNTEQNAVSDTFFSLCAASCEDDETWAMVCAWQAIANLPAACANDGSFAGVIGERSLNADALDGEVGDGFDKHDDDARVAPAGAIGSSVRLFSCDEHAVCYGCSAGNSTYCQAVSDYYGGAGVEYYYNGTYFPKETWDGRTYVGANAAFQAINNDWNYWCSDATLAKIAGGAYNGTVEGASARR